MTTAWYLGIDERFVADRAILVGDPGRADLFAEQLNDVVANGGERALRTVSGTYRNRRVTVCAFGMGAPIAVIVLEELAALGVRAVLRAGTVMSLGEIPLGTLVLAERAIRGEATSATYLRPDGPAEADPALLTRAHEILGRGSTSYRCGMVASYDGFYSQLLAMREEQQAGVEALRRELREQGVLAVDMETSALLAVAPLLGVRAGSLCIATVDGPTRQRLEGGERSDGERLLVEAALEIITSLSVEEP
ncbi:MAG: nucleoside phosphorylase [Candidatus Limnocylindria bacterium]